MATALPTSRRHGEDEDEVKDHGTWDIVPNRLVLLLLLFRHDYCCFIKMMFSFLKWYVGQCRYSLEVLCFSSGKQPSHGTQLEKQILTSSEHTSLIFHFTQINLDLRIKNKSLWEQQEDTMSLMDVC